MKEFNIEPLLAMIVKVITDVASNSEKVIAMDLH